ARPRGRGGSAGATLAAGHPIRAPAYPPRARDHPPGPAAPSPPAAATRATIPPAASCGRSKRSATRSTSSRRPHSSPRHFHLSRHRAEVVPPALRSPQQRKPLPARPPSHRRPPGGPLVPRRHPELREVPQDHFHGRGCAPGHPPSQRYGCMGDIKKAWRSAVERAGFTVGRADGFVWHNTRYSAVTNLTNAGVPRHEAKTVSGHVTDSVFDRYSI